MNKTALILRITGQDGSFLTDPLLEKSHSVHGLIPAMLSALFLFAAFGQQPSEDHLNQKAQQAKSMMSAGRYEEAIPIYQQLVKAVPGNPGLVLNLALAQHMAGH